MSIEENKDYFNAMSFLESLGKMDTPLQYMADRIDKDLNKYILRIQELLDNLGNPEKEFKYIHVTGTAGKGSTVNMLHQMLYNAGYKVGSTSSPASVSTIERIKVNELYIDPKEFAKIVESIKPIILKMYLNSDFGKPSYFDIILAIALVYFRETKCEWVVLEVGMGGRFDSTNVIPSPEVVAITNIGLDHINILGGTVEKIAYEKAGIIKPHSNFFTTENDPKLLDLFREICLEKNANFFSIKPEYNPNKKLVQAIGDFLEIDNKYISSSCNDTKLPCRFEVVSRSPLIILDGAHNVRKIKFSLEKLKEFTYNNLTVIFGAGHNKDALGMLDLIVPYCSKIFLTPVINSMGKSFSVKEMYNYLISEYSNVSVSVVLENKEALKIALKENDSNAILVIGSFYLSGKIREKWFPESLVLKKRKSF